MEFKPTKPASIDQYSSAAERGKGCGCVGIGCLASVILLVVMCVGSYVAMVHTSLPLAMIERAIEEGGNARVEGLRGSMASGFEMDKLEFLSEDGKHWNELRGVKFAFNGIFDLMRNERIVIEEASIAGAKIYAEYEEPEFQDKEAEIDFNWFVEDVDLAGDGFKEGLDDFQREINQDGVNELKEFRIDLINIRDIEIVNPVTDERLHVEQVEFRGFRFAQGDLDSMGQFTVKSDFVDVDSKQSVDYPNEKLAWHLTGSLKTALHPLMIAPVPFELDTAVFDDNRSAMSASLCGDAIKVSDPSGKVMTITVSEFNLGEYFDPGTTVVPTNWTLNITSERPEEVAEDVNAPSDEVDTADEPEPEPESDEEFAVDPAPEVEPAPAARSVKRIVSFLPGSHFDLGKTQFEIEPASFDVVSNMEPPLLLNASGMIGDKQVTATLRSQRKAPFVFVELSAEGMQPHEIWAQLFFEKPYEELDDDAKASIDAVLKHENGNIVEPVDF